MSWLSFLSLVGLLALEYSHAFSTIHQPTITRRVSALAASRPGKEDDITASKSTSNLVQQRREFVLQSIVSAGIVSSAIITTSPFVQPALAEDAQPTTIDPSIDLPKITKKVYVDVKFPKYKEPKRLVIGLFGEVMPKTVDNFVSLCTNNSDGDGPSYSGSNFYRGEYNRDTIILYLVIVMLHFCTSRYLYHVYLVYGVPYDAV